MRFETEHNAVALVDVDGARHTLCNYYTGDGYARYAARWRNLAGPLYKPLKGKRRRMVRAARELEKRRSYEAVVEAGRRAELELLSKRNP